MAPITSYCSEATPTSIDNSVSTDCSFGYSTRISYYTDNKIYRKARI